MPRNCSLIRADDGTTMIVCGRKKRRYCHVCGYTADYLCDWRITKTSKTCSAPLCKKHRHVAGPGIDYCRFHIREAVKERLTPQLPFEQASS